MTYKIVYDENEIEKFYDRILPPLNPLEVHFISLSARNKYLTDEEKTYYELGRTEMFAKTIIRRNTFRDYLKHVLRLECNKGGYLTRNGKTIPEKAMVCYANLSPSSTIAAISKLQKLLADYNLEALTTLAQGRDPENILNRINKIDNNILSFYQNSPTTKTWLDVDFDLMDSEWDRKEALEAIKKGVEDFGFDKTLTEVIETKSGYHLLLHRKSLKSNPQNLIRGFDGYQGILFKEVGINKNEMVPLPGTYQGGFPVRFLTEKEW